MKYLIVCLLALLLFATCKPAKKITKESKTDSVWVVPKPIDIKITGGTTPAVNLDSVKQLISVLAKGGKSTKQVIYISDTSGKAQLKFWQNTAGQIYADCTAKDQEFKTTLYEKNRLIRELKDSKVVKTRLPVWCWVIFAVAVLALIIEIVLFIKRKYPL